MRGGRWLAIAPVWRQSEAEAGGPYLATPISIFWTAGNRVSRPAFGRGQRNMDAFPAKAAFAGREKQATEARGAHPKRKVLLTSTMTHGQGSARPNASEHLTRISGSGERVAYSAASWSGS